jgi:inosose dehydratase
MQYGEYSLMSATQAGLFPCLGSGDVPVAETIHAVESNGFQGWYVIEQDVAITEGDPPVGEGPVLGVAQSLRYLRELVASATRH